MPAFPGATNAEPCDARQHLIYGLQLLAGLKAHGFARRNADLGAGFRIAAYAGLARAHVEDPETAQLNAVTTGERTFHALKHGFHSLLGLGLGDASLSNNFVDNIELNHAQLRMYRKYLNCG